MLNSVELCCRWTSAPRVGRLTWWASGRMAESCSPTETSGPRSRRRSPPWSARSASDVPTMTRGTSFHALYRTYVVDCTAPTPVWDAQPSVADFVTGCVAHAGARLQHSAAAVSAAGMVSWIELQYLSRPSHFLATRFLDSFVCLPGCAQGLLVQSLYYSVSTVPVLRPLRGCFRSEARLSSQ